MYIVSLAVGVEVEEEQETVFNTGSNIHSSFSGSENPATAIQLVRTSKCCNFVVVISCTGQLTGSLVIEPGCCRDQVEQVTRARVPGQKQREDSLTYKYTGVHYAQTSDWFEVWARQLSSASGVVVVFSRT